MDEPSRSGTFEAGGRRATTSDRDALPTERDDAAGRLPVARRPAARDERDGAGPSDERVAPASFLARWKTAASHDLTTSDSETVTLTDLIAAAEPADRTRWNDLQLGYADPRGAAYLRASIAARHEHLHADDVLCCAGAQEAVTCVVRAIVGPADHAIVVLPIYEPSERAVTSACATTGVALLSEEDWHLDVDRIASALRPNTRLVLINFPNSPTGAAIRPETLRALVELCRRRGVWLVNDEVYRQTCAASEPTPMLADIYERGVSINGLSKGFGLPGLRVGWAACRDRDLLGRALAEKSMLSCCLASTSEVLAHIAIRQEARIVHRRREIGLANYARLRSLTEGAHQLFDHEPIRNAAFLFPRYLGRDGVAAFSARLAQDGGILVMPSTIWRSRLAEMPEDRVRIGLGHEHSGIGIDALERYASSAETQHRRTPTRCANGTSR